MGASYPELVRSTLGEGGGAILGGGAVLGGSPRAEEGGAPRGEGGAVLGGNSPPLREGGGAPSVGSWALPNPDNVRCTAPPTGAATAP